MTILKEAASTALYGSSAGNGVSLITTKKGKESGGTGVNFCLLYTSDSFQNWRGMRERGGRRVKRSINIDMNTVRFCTPEQMKKFEKQVWMSGFEKTGKEEVRCV